jgi:hypothetical protein
VTVRGALLCLALAAAAGAQGAAYLQDHYRKQEVRIPMRDGVRLYTAVYTPRDGGPWPFLLHRTPYGIDPYGPEAFPSQLGPDEELAREGCIFVYQDVRGKRMSEGSFHEMTPLRDGRGVDEATDAWDTIDWLLRHVPGGNGRVGAWGVSYPGFYAACTLAGSHPALRAVSPQAPMADLFRGDDDHHNGALFLAQTFWYDAEQGMPRPAPAPIPPAMPKELAGPVPDDYQFFLALGALPEADRRYFRGRVRTWSDEMAHGTLDGYWRSRELLPHLRAVQPAVLTVGGWFDAEDLYGTLGLHRRLQDCPGADTFLVMGPWPHGGWAYEPGTGLGELQFGSATGQFFRSQVEAPFFRHYLMDAPDPGLPKALVFETGTNQWRRFDAWPPVQARPTALYLDGGGRLTFQAPEGPAEADRFTSDPAHPVPYTNRIDRTVAPEFMVEDQRFAARRPDVLVYRTEPLERPLTVAGPVQAELWVSTTGTDADWVVKLVDVYPGEAGDPAPEGPGGFQQLVRAEVMRGKFRHSLERPEPFKPGRAEPVAFGLDDICHSFRAGHRIMVQIQSSWFPLVDRNPQVFEDIYQARERDFRPAEHRVFHGGDRASRLVLPLLP